MNEGVQVEDEFVTRRLWNLRNKDFSASVSREQYNSTTPTKDTYIITGKYFDRSGTIFFHTILLLYTTHSHIVTVTTTCRKVVHVETQKKYHLIFLYFADSLLLFISGAFFSSFFFLNR